MYLACRRVRGAAVYSIRESYPAGERFCSRHLCGLGANPAEWIVYPGGNAFYVSPEVEEALRNRGVQPGADELEDLFWCFVRPDIRRAVEGFRDRARARRPRRTLSRAQLERLQHDVQPFDKRRIHYLRCGRPGPGDLSRMPTALYRWLYAKSRDEIEQRFLALEAGLPAREHKSYVYAVFDLQRFFPSPLLKRMPEAIDTDELDSRFLEELCRLNRDRAFWGEAEPGGLRAELVRYLILFFDQEFPGSRTPWDFFREELHRRRYRPVAAAPPRICLGEAACLFGVSEQSLQKASRRGLVRLYRHAARKCHPDAGGSHDRFIRLTRAFQELIRRKS